MAQYVPNTWADGSSGGTPITAAKLTAIEDQLVANDLQNTSSEAFATLSTRFTNVGAWAINTFYAVNNVCTSGGALFYCLTAHTSTGPAPTGAGNSNWAVLSTNVAIGTQAGQAADGAATAASLALKADKTTVAALPQTVLWDATNNVWPTPNATALRVEFNSLSTPTADVTPPPYFNDASYWKCRVDA